ncbi:unnamed protein product [Prorocentrum cordatum]|uniref:ABC transporter domain-containing protein n=1 Tax=Prorocentrum cordatum TaxID=2364126 RepID=A0ABN9UES3_9DINO|nr:unnamed protein product [Polarella glacialis]
MGMHLEEEFNQSRGDPLYAEAVQPPKEPPPGLVVGLVTECFPGVDQEVLASCRDELDRIQRLTSAQLTAREDLSGGYTLVVAGTRPIVERAAPQVERALAGAGRGGTPALEGAAGRQEPCTEPDRPAEVQPDAAGEASARKPPWRKAHRVASKESQVEEHLNVPAGTVSAAVIEADTPHDDNPIPIGPSSFLTSAIFAAAARAVGPPAAPEMPAPGSEPEGEPAEALSAASVEPPQPRAWTNLPPLWENETAGPWGAPVARPPCGPAPLLTSARLRNAPPPPAAVLSSFALWFGSADETPPSSCEEWFSPDGFNRPQRRIASSILVEPAARLQELDENSVTGQDGPDVAKVIKFVFPMPCAMEGVKSRKKIVFKMCNVSFAYPVSKSPSILDLNIEMSQASRILVTGAKGSGKSTLVKVLIGKLKLTEGAIQKAVGLSVAYVSQHMFNQLEECMHMTPLQYMMERFASGSDRENPELQQYQKRRLPTRDDIEQHCSDFGVDQESVNRLHIKQLNKSMRFKLVLSAALWLNPNLLVLDEPASCLERCSLEALAAAIEDYKGGVLITSHSKDRHYFEAAATERYVLRGGRLRADAQASGDGTAVSACEAHGSAGTGRGAAGLQGLTAKQARDLYQDISRRLKEGQRNKTLTDSDMWAMLRELEELKRRLEA